MLGGREGDKGELEGRNRCSKTRGLRKCPGIKAGEQQAPSTKLSHTEVWSEGMSVNGVSPLPPNKFGLKKW